MEHAWFKYSLILICFLQSLHLAGCKKSLEARPVMTRIQMAVPFPEITIPSSKPVPSPPRNFEEAKRAAAKIFAQHPISFYCSCRFNKAGQIQSETCSYQPTSWNKRTFKIEWEHIVPAKRLGEDLPCWTQKICKTRVGEPYKGRACCSHQSQTFQKREADLHNLVPAIGLLNQARGTLSFGKVDFHIPNFMGCPLKIDRTKKLVEPMPHIRGTIARAYLYMQDYHHIKLPHEEYSRYQQWHLRYPPDQWEIKWNALIKAIQGNSNPYIETMKKSAHTL